MDKNDTLQLKDVLLDVDDIDTSQYKTWKPEDFIREIKKLRKESGKWRINFREQKNANTELSDNFAKLQKALDLLNNQHERLKKEVDSGAFVKVESVNVMRDTLIKDTKDFETKYNNAVAELSKERLLRDAYNSIHSKGYKFKNKQERIGFEASMLQTKKDGSLKTQEEIGDEVESFLTENFEPSKLPPPGPKTSDTNPRQEIARLLARGDKITPEEVSRVRELEKKLETA
jgi:hypothetical protein